MDKLQPGQMLGAYRIINQIGEGGMATVYKAYQISMDRNVAIKVLPGQLAQSEEFVKRFQQEARIIARLEHPYILPVFDYGEENGVAYFVMRYLEAGTLKDKMQAGQLPLNEIDDIFTQLTDALGYAHGQGIVHRDLKPANILVDSTGHVFLTDFGIAKLLESASPRLTQTDAIMGTPAYISPEQAAARGVDQRSDIYSLGVILYEMVAGRVPYVADTPLAVILKHMNEPLPIPSTLKPDIPLFVEQVIIKALAKDPKDRFAGAAEFAAAWKRSLREGGAAPEKNSAPKYSPNAPTQVLPASSVQTGSKAGLSTTSLAIGCVALFCIFVAAIGAFGVATNMLGKSAATSTVPAPTQTPLPTVTPTSSSFTLLEDDFSQKDVVWGTINDSDGSIEYSEETLRVILETKNWFIWSRPNDIDYENVHMEVTIFPNNSDQYTSFGLMCGQQANDEAYYYFAITPAGQYAIARAVSGEADLFLTNDDEWDYSNAIPRNASSYRLGADCSSDGTLSLYVNGEQVDSVSDTSYLEGHIGIIVWSAEAEDAVTDVVFDDFVVNTLP